jgi:HD-like signal output (HDOD) protein
MTSNIPLLQQLARFAAKTGVGLPVVSPVALQLLTSIRDEEADARDVERLIQSDQALAAEVLSVANSAFYGGLASITTVQGAIFRLGLSQVARLALLATERNQYTVRQPSLRDVTSRLWAHASATAQASQWLARRLGHRNVEQEAFVGGLVHDVGKLYLVRMLDEMASRATVPITPPSSFLLEVLAVAHAEQGHQLMTQWNLPDVYRVVVRDHHVDEPDATSVILLIVRLANRACHKMGIGLKSEPSLVLSVLPEAAMLLASEVLLAELEVLLEDVAADLAAQAVA